MMPSSIPPYTPDFGKVPPFPVGRADQLDWHERALVENPSDPAYTRAIIGERGVGKTVYLRLLADRMRVHGWAILTYRPPAKQNFDVLTELLQRLPDALSRGPQSGRWRTVERELSVQLGPGFLKASGRVTQRRGERQPSPSYTVERALVRVGESAKGNETGLLVEIDEAQLLDDQLGALAPLMQTVVKDLDLPVAFALAGTSELRDLLLSSGSFPERMDRIELSMLSPEQARLALMQPANDRGVVWQPRALDAVLNAAAGYPYFVQRGGYEAWKAERHDAQIRVPAANAAVSAIGRDADRIFGARWDRLGPLQHRYLAAAATLAQDGAGIASTREIAARLGRSLQDLSRVRDTLITEHHLLRDAGRGWLQFALPLYAQWVVSQADTISPSPAPSHGRMISYPGPPEVPRGESGEAEALALTPSGPSSALQRPQGVAR